MNKFTKVFAVTTLAALMANPVHADLAADVAAVTSYAQANRSGLAGNYEAISVNSASISALAARPLPTQGDTGA